MASEKLGITNFCWSVGLETSKIFRGWINTKKNRAARAPLQAKETVNRLVTVSTLYHSFESSCAGSMPHTRTLYIHPLQVRGVSTNSSNCSSRNKVCQLDHHSGACLPLEHRHQSGLTEMFLETVIQPFRDATWDDFPFVELSSLNSVCLCTWYAYAVSIRYINYTY